LNSIAAGAAAELPLDQRLAALAPTTILES